ncbi:Ig-like domain-containing protein [Streptomyces telluris]|uniref:Ig-like domain-containing protein n=1 Tax=Streptomyces telluris TaxID=2720021 RepID=A0A9X2LL13_9ACTN|nr:Ig-like domain-containing protein [Streptomyces telluris]MCQ8773138.1 Ig-like domain-containing protein [Streptomyces telluris]NJP81434.1 cadherin-like domain-containing protein [Streptomyces telluris]
MTAQRRGPLGPDPHHGECAPAWLGSATITDNKVRYTPQPDYVGTDTFTYTISDIFGQTATVTVTVTVG